jgi:hypothetical protein
MGKNLKVPVMLQKGLVKMVKTIPKNAPHNLQADSAELHDSGSSHGNRVAANSKLSYWLRFVLSGRQRPLSLRVA